MRPSTMENPSRARTGGVSTAPRASDLPGSATRGDGRGGRRGSRPIRSCAAVVSTASRTPSRRRSTPHMRRTSAARRRQARTRLATASRRWCRQRAILTLEDGSVPRDEGDDHRVRQATRRCVSSSSARRAGRSLRSTTRSGEEQRLRAFRRVGEAENEADEVCQRSPSPGTSSRSPMHERSSSARPRSDVPRRPEEADNVRIQPAMVMTPRR